MQGRFAKPILGALALLVLVPLAASAQSTFTGQVRDESGGVLPGVTVEAASPALIEKVRTVVSDDQGRYRIVDLRPGVYKLTFTLTGFGSLVRDGVDLPANLVVTVNADLKVGALEETVTVSGQAAQVDVQQASRTQVLNREVLDALPVSRNSMAVGYLAPGVRMSAPDIGGTNLTSQPGMRAHGMRAPHGVLQLVDGLTISTYEDSQLFYFDESAQSEVSVTTSAMPAENSTGGIRINSILRDGGNIFSGGVFLSGTDGNWLSDNVDDKLRKRGIQKADSVAHLQNFNGTVGGPIKKDKVWFIVGARNAGTDNTVANVPEEIVAPDGEVVRAVSDGYIRDVSVRLTWQATPKQKYATFVQRVWKRLGHSFGFGTDPRVATQRDPHHAHNYMAVNKWSMTPSSQWLIEAGWSAAVFNWRSTPFDQTRLQAPFTPLWYAMANRTDTALNINRDCAYSFGCTNWMTNIDNRTEAGRLHTLAAVSYVTGTHNLKVGFTHTWGLDSNKRTRNGHLNQNYVNGRPSTVTVFNDPFDAPGYVDYDVGVYVQDAWTIRRLTVNPGVRVEWFRSSMHETTEAAGRFAPARFYPKQNTPAWGPDWAPRLSAVYDVFGDGKTALKVSYGKYYEQLTAATYAKRYADAASASESRNWFDEDLIPGTSTRSGNALPTNGDGIAQDNEIGPTSNPLFGKRADINPEPGFRRLANLEYSAGVQHQLLPRVAVNAAYYRRTWDGINVTDRTLISRSDYTSFQIPMPSFANDPTLVGAGVLDPNEILTVYNLNRAKGSVFNSAQLDRNAPNDQSIYTGVELSFSARLGRGGNVFGSWNTEHNLSVFCDYDDDPNGTGTGTSNAGENDLYQGELVSNGGRFCDQRQFGMPFRQEFKLAGSYPLAYGVTFGAVVQSYAGRERTITYTVPASLFPGGRTNSETIILTKPGTLYQERYNQVDINVRKNFRIGKKVFTGQLDLFNALNNNAIFATNNAIGSSLGVVTSTLVGRLPRVVFEMKF